MIIKIIKIVHKQKLLMRLITIEMWMKCLNLHTGLQVEIPANILNEGLQQ